MLTADHLRSMVSGWQQGQYRIHCPACHPTRRNKREETLSVLVESQTFAWQCWHCGETGKSNFRTAPSRMEFQPKPKPAAIKVDDLRPLTDAALAFLRGRGLSVEAADLRSCTRYFPKLEREVEAIAFLTKDDNGQVVSVKYRAIEDKAFASAGSQSRYWNLERVEVTEDEPQVIITEGEFDTLALLTCGYRNVISVPSGASAASVGGAERGRGGYIASAEKIYNKAKRVILFVDQDEPGRALADELARRIGKHRCYFCLVPPDCKDANDVLVRHGLEALRGIVDAARPWPVAGLYDATHYAARVLDLYENGSGSGISTGLPGVDKVYTVAPGMITVVTGIPSSGKSEFIDQVMVNLAMTQGWSFCIASFENPPDRHIVKLVEKYTGYPFFKGNLPRMDQGRLDDALRWVNNHFTFIEAADGMPSTLESILDRAKVSVMRRGCRGLVIDPYNFIEKTSSTISETEQVSEMLSAVKRFANAHEVHTWFVAHPAKMYRQQDGSTPVPTGYDILGSSHWYNKADFGLTVHRMHDMNQVTMVRCWKARFKWIAKNGDAYLSYDVPTGRYTDAETDEPPQRRKAKEEDGSGGYWHL